MLRFSEEIMLLLLHDEDGRFARVPDWSVRYALGGGVLMDLALEDRIDTDPSTLILLDKTPVGDDLLDPMLADIASAQETRDARYWVERAAARADQIRERALERLIKGGILEQRDDRFLWVFRARRYPIVDGQAEREVKLRIMGVLFSDDIPDPRDIVILCLADACGIFKELLTPREVELAAKRIEQVRKMDLIGQAVTRAVWDIESSLAIAAQPQFF
ncbi:MAG: GPP34 family phosphoprotein [Gammaproteobacteria bacterium]|nr:GPP34 family phosphoprotein [Gammaproteobacteria bacterium]MYB36562.1 GPP34 family phosphoprotein [Gammaproteobacteria bacterium]